MGKQLVKIVKEICLENDLNLKTYSDEYILQIEKDKKLMFIIGNKFPNNNASIEQICNDKSALSDLLEYFNIPHIPHHYFLSPLIEDKSSLSQGIFLNMMNLLNKYESLVCKVNRGTGGKNVYKVSNQKELEAAILNIFNQSTSMTISPYYEIENEYRVLVLNNEVKYIFKKIRPFVIGDGVSSINTLLYNHPNKDKIIPEETLDLNYIPMKDEKVEVSWKHNLGQGATPELIKDKKIISELTEIALKCSTSLDIGFASIDIIEANKHYFVLEINSGVMIESFSKYNEENYELVKCAISEAIDTYFNKK